jgi:hypothetical protein
MGRGLRHVHKVNPFDNQNTISIENRDMLILCSLNKQGLNMLEYLLRNGNVYEKKFLVSPDDYLSEMKFTSTKSFYLGIDNLIRWDVIAKSKDVNFYYINVKFFPNVKL